MASTSTAPASSMQLTLKDAARLLAVSERAIYRWIREGSIPHRKVHEQYRFNRVELLEWATRNRLRVSPGIFAERAEDGPATMLADALARGGVHYDLPAADQETLLRAAVRALPLPEAVDREFVVSMLLARERSHSTAIGSGVAVPHVRDPVVLPVDSPLVGLCFPSQPLDFGAHDGELVRALFVLVTPTIRAHLQILARLARALHEARLIEALRRPAPAGEILALVREIEASSVAAGISEEAESPPEGT